MTENKVNPREFWITNPDDGYKGIYSEKPDFKYNDMYHVIEYLAYEIATDKIEELSLKGYDDGLEIQSLLSDITILKAKLDKCILELKPFSGRDGYESVNKLLSELSEGDK